MVLSTKLEISLDHLDFTLNCETILARLLSVGDFLNLNNKEGSIQIQDIVIVRSKGIYASFTPSRQLVVNNGILVSSFVSLSSLLVEKEKKMNDMLFYNDNKSLFFTFLGRMISILHHWIEYLFQFPHQLVCHHYFNQNHCLDATYDIEIGMNT